MTDTPHNEPLLARRTLLKTAAVAAVAATLTAPLVITQAQDGPAPLRRAHAPFDPAHRPPLPPLEVIALNRMAFGPRAGDLEAFRALGSNDDQRIQAYVDQQLNPQAINDSDCDARIQAAGFQTLNKSRAQLWLDHVLPNPPWQTRILPITETVRATYIRQIYSKRQLTEVLADYWHNHFSVYGYDYYVAPMFVHYDRDVIRAHMLGNFRTMLEAVATSTAMLYYLDNTTSSDGGPNENFARELFELHTLGAENYYGVIDRNDVPTGPDGKPLGYCDGDVYEACRCFTGWRIADGWESPDTGEFYYREDWHDRFQKLVLGRYFPESQATIALKDGRDVLDLLAQHPGTGRHVARRLCRRLIGDNPPASVVNGAAALFTANWQAPDQLRQVVRYILLSPEFRAIWGEKVKRPLEHLIGTFRITGAEWNPPSDPWWYNQSGQKLFNWRPPDGYPDLKEDWTSTMPMLQRWRTSNWIMVGVDDIDVTTPILAQSPPSGTANQLADLWIGKVLGRPMEYSGHRDEIVRFMANGLGPDVPINLSNEDNAERLVHMVGLLLLCPDFNYR